jgi:hypothetical protein
MRWSSVESYPTFEFGVVDAESVAFNGDGDRGWPLLCRRVLHGERSIPVRLVIFDLLLQGNRRASFMARLWPAVSGAFGDAV